MPSLIPRRPMIDLYELAANDPDIRFSPYCWRIRMALAHKAIRVRLLPWQFGGRKLPGGQKQVPILVDDGEIIADSTTIAFHLERKYHHGPTLFGGEGGEAHARFVVAWTDLVLHPALLPVVAPDLLKLVKPDMQPAFRETRENRMGMTIEAALRDRPVLMERARRALTPVRRVLKTTPFLGGEEPSYADYAVFGAFQWVRCASGLDILQPDDPIFAWREQLLDLFDDLARDAALAA